MKIMLNSWIIIIVFSCGSGTVKEKKGMISTVNSAEYEPSIKDLFVKDSVPTKIFINNDDFIFGILNNDLTYLYLEGTSTSKTETTVPNLHNKSVNDTIVTFFNRNDIFRFHKSPSNTILMEAEINSDHYELENGQIKIGGPFNYFKDKLNIDTPVDTLIVKDFENSSYFMFMFDEFQMLNKIVYRSRYLD